MVRHTVLQTLHVWWVEWAVCREWKAINSKIDNYLISFIQQIGKWERFITQNPPIRGHLSFPYLTSLDGEIELQCEDDYGITKLERSNGFHMLMRTSELVPQPTAHEAVLFTQNQCKWNCLLLQVYLLTLLMTFYFETSCSYWIATPAVTLGPAHGI